MLIEIKGKYGTANCFAPDVEERVVDDVTRILSCPLLEGRQIAIMPDAHPNGNGTVTGFTMTDGDEVILGLEVDSGCGVSYSVLDVKEQDVDFELLDSICHEIPAGIDCYIEPAYDYDFTSLHCYEALRLRYAWPVYLGTLGGGNHFIELDKDEDGKIYLVIHNGLGMYSGPAVEYYLKKSLQKSGKTKENMRLEDAILTGEDKKEFLEDMKFFERLCEVNRAYINDYITKKMGWTVIERNDICHHYQSARDGIIRHGAISAHKGERVLIPVNARDGCLLGIGKGNAAWNYSAPHGGGRLLTRKEAHHRFTMDEYYALMKKVHSSTVCLENIDEIPTAYRSLAAIAKAIENSVDIQHVLRPLFSYKGV